MNGGVNELGNEFLDGGVAESVYVTRQDLFINSSNSILRRSEHGQDSEMSLETEINSERSSLGVHGSQEKEILEKLTFFELFSVEDGSIIEDVG